MTRPLFKYRIATLLDESGEVVIKLKVARNTRVVLLLDYTKGPVVRTFVKIWNDNHASDYQEVKHEFRDKYA